MSQEEFFPAAYAYLIYRNICAIVWPFFKNVWG